VVHLWVEFAPVDHFEKLKNYLDSLPTGPISESSKIMGLLEDCWEEFDGSYQEKMQAEKLDRIEKVTWNPPILEFEIERHGGTVQGSSRAERHGWSVDVQAKTATCQGLGFAQSRPRQPPFKVDPITEDLIRCIVEERTDERLKRNPNGSVRILISKIDELTSGYKQTQAGRRKRFCEALDKRLAAAGWEKITHYRFRPPHPHP